MPTWDISNFTSATINTILLDPGATTVSGVSRVVAIDGDGYLEVSSALIPGGAVSNEASMELARSIPEQATFQFEMKVNDLPPDLNSLNLKRLFIAMYDKQEDTAGLVFSQSGLAWASTASGVVSITPVPGSSSLITTGTWYTIRLVVDGANGWMYIYITPSASLPTTGHILRYQTSSLDTSVSIAADKLRVESFGLPLEPTDVRIREFLACSGLAIPNKVPIADTGTDRAVPTGRYAALDGRDSYDPEGATLSYSWAMYNGPYESEYVSYGTDGSTPSEADADAVTNTVYSSSGFASLEHLAEGDVIKVGSTYAIISSTSFHADGSLVDDYTLTLTTDALAEGLTNQEWVIYHKACIGNTSTSITYAYIDKPGLYEFRLVVNDGSLDSYPGSLLIQGYDEAIGRAGIPDFSFIWKCLGSDWGYVDDKDKITTAWDAFSLVASGFILWLWQINANKSLKTIPRRFVRKWQDISTRVEKDAWDEVTFNHLYPAIYNNIGVAGGLSVNGKTLIVYLAGTKYTITFSGVDPIPYQTIISQINTVLPASIAGHEVVSGTRYLKLEHTDYFHVSEESTALADLGLGSTMFGNVLSGTGAFLTDPNNSMKSVQLTATPVTKPLQLTKITDYSKYMFVANGFAYRIGSATSDISLLLIDPLPEDTTYEWAILPTVELTEFTSEDYRLCDDDYVEVSFTKDGGTTSSTVWLPCGGGVENKVAFDPTSWAEYDYDFVEVENLIKRQYVPLQENTLSIPYLESSVENPEQAYKENKDYIVVTYDDAEWVYFFEVPDEPPAKWWAEFYYYSNNPIIEDNFGYAIDFLEENAGDIDYLSAVQGLYYSYFTGPIFDSLKLGLQILFNLPIAEVQGTILDIDTAYTSTEVRVLVEDADGSGNVRDYLFLREADLNTNPATGETYAVGDTVEQFAPLCTGVYLIDYLQNEDWFYRYWKQGVFYDVEKYHKFLVSADLDIVGLENISLIVSYLDRAKPTYTHYLLAPRKSVEDEIDVTDNIWFKLVMKLYDNPCPAPSGGVKMYDDYDGSGAIRHRFDQIFEEDPEYWAYDTTLHEGERQSPHYMVDGLLIGRDTPYLIGDRDLTGLDFSTLNTKTLVITPANGVCNPDLVAVGGWNKDDGNFALDYARDGGTLTPVYETGMDLDTSYPYWNGYGALKIDNVPAVVPTPHLIFDGTNVVDTMVDSGCIGFYFRPRSASYSPSLKEKFVCICGSFANPLANAVNIYHEDVAGTLKLKADIRDSTGALIDSLEANFNPVTGSWYDIELNFDVVNGVNKLFIDGAVVASGTGTGTRDSNIKYLMFGADFGGPMSTVFDLDNCRFYDKKLHTAAYNPSVWFSSTGGCQTYYDPGTVTVTFSGLTGVSTISDVCNQINGAISRTTPTAPTSTFCSTATEYQEDGKSYLCLKSWNSYLKVDSGTALSILGFTAGTEKSYYEVPNKNLILMANFNGTKIKLIRLLNSCAYYYARHRQNTPSAYHAVSDTTNTLAAPGLLDTATDSQVIAFAVDFRTQWNAHDNNNGGAYHGAAGSYQITAGAPTDLHEVKNVVNEIKAQMLAHIDDGVIHASADVDNRTEVADVTYCTFDYVRDGADPDPVTTSGTSTDAYIDITDPKFGVGCLHLYDAVGVTYTGANLVDDIWNTGCIRFWWKAPYSGHITTNNTIIRIQDAAGAPNNNQIRILHSSTNRLICNFRDNTGALLASVGGPASDLPLVQDKWYYFEVDWDFTSGNQYLFIDGDLKVHSTVTGSRMGGQQYMVLGDEGGTDPSGDFDALEIYTTVQNRASYSVPTAPPRVDYHGLRKDKLCPEVYIEGVMTTSFAPVIAPDVVLVAHMNDTTPAYDMDYIRDGGTPVDATSGTVTIDTPSHFCFDNGYLDVTGGGAHAHLSYTGNNVVSAVGAAGAISFWLKTGYTGSPGGVDQYFLAMSDAAGSTNNGIELYHNGADREFWCDIRNSFGMLSKHHSYTGAPYPMTGEWVYVEVDWDTTGIWFFIDGVLGAPSGGPVLTHGSGMQYIVIGDSLGGAGNVNNFYFDELVVYDAVQHTADFDAPTWEMKVDPLITYDSIYTFDGTTKFTYDDAKSGTQTSTRILSKD